MADLLIIGAGPYGISLAAHAKAAGLSYVLLGKPMFFWKEQMPQTMFIRTNPLYISLSDSEGRWTIQRYCEETETPLVSPFPRPAFVDYAFWFAQRADIAFTPEMATGVERTADGYAVLTDAGNRWTAPKAVIATGLQYFHYIPPELRTLPSGLLTHTFGQTGFARFRGRSVAVIGSGQSAWEAAALLHQSGADVEILFRREETHFAGEDNTASGQRLIDNAEQFYHWPPEQKEERWNTERHGSVAPFLRPYVEGKVKITGGVEIVKAEATEDGSKALLTLGGGSGGQSGERSGEYAGEQSRVVDHVVSATGYRVNLDLLPWLPQTLREQIVRESGRFGGFPLLSEQFESSLPGLYFTGHLATHTHGGSFGFIAGLGKACRTIIPHIAQSSAVPRFSLTTDQSSDPKKAR